MDYLHWAQEKSFEELPFNEVDNILLSQIVYLPLGGAFENKEEASVLEAALAVEHVEGEKVYEVFLRRRLEALRHMGAAPRYYGMMLSRFRDELCHVDQRQFSALCATLPDGLRAVIYRGTDTTLVGWKEDFNMSFESPVPAQRSALEYLEEAAGEGNPLVVLGHSKGGNLAVYAASKAHPDIQRRIQSVYTNDGPGLVRQDVESEGYARIRDRIISLLPQGTVVGILLHQHRPYRVVKSRALSFFQHDAFSWEVEEGQAQFQYLPELSRRSLLMEESLDKWLTGLSFEERQVFSDTIYEVLTAGADQTLGELMHTDLKRAGKILDAARAIPPEIRSQLLKAFGGLFSTALGGIVQQAKQTVMDLLPGDWGDKDKTDEQETAPQPQEKR